MTGASGILFLWHVLSTAALWTSLAWCLQLGMGPVLPFMFTGWTLVANLAHFSIAAALALAPGSPRLAAVRRLHAGSFGVCFAMSCVTCGAFWGLTLSLGDVVIPAHVRELLPSALNHFLHSLPLALVLLEPLLVPPHALRAWRSERIAMWCVGGAYLLLLLWVRHAFSHAVYPFLRYFDGWAFALFALLVAAAIRSIQAALGAWRRAAAQFWSMVGGGGGGADPGKVSAGTRHL